MEKTFYLYRITNLINGKYYLGKRVFNGSDATKDHKYLGSGRLIVAAVKKYGKSNFNKEILSYHTGKDELALAESLLVTEREIADKECYNITLGGHGGNLGSLAAEKLKKTQQTPEYKKNMSDALNVPEVKQKISASLKETMSDPEWKIKFSKIQKEAQNRPAERLRNSRNQKEAQNRPEVAESKSKRMKEAFSNESTEEKHKAACNTPEWKKIHSMKNKDTVWINNGVNQKYVKQPLLEEYIDNGWKLGMLKRK